LPVTESPDSVAVVVSVPVSLLLLTSVWFVSDWLVAVLSVLVLLLP